MIFTGRIPLYLEFSPFHTCLFSSPEHEVLMVSYCGQWVVRRRPSCVGRRASTFDVYTL